MPRNALLICDTRTVEVQAPYSSVSEVVVAARLQGATICLPVAGRLFEAFTPGEIRVVTEVPKDWARAAVVVELPRADVILEVAA